MITAKIQQYGGCITGIMQGNLNYTLKDGRRVTTSLGVELYSTDGEIAVTLPTSSIFEDDYPELNVLLGHGAEDVVWRDKTYNSVYHAKLDGEVCLYTSQTAAQEGRIVDPSQYLLWPGDDDGRRQWYDVTGSRKVVSNIFNLYNRVGWLYPTGVAFLAGEQTIDGYRFLTLLRLVVAGGSRPSVSCFRQIASSKIVDTAFQLTQPKQPIWDSRLGRNVYWQSELLDHSVSGSAYWSETVAREYAAVKAALERGVRLLSLELDYSSFADYSYTLQKATITPTKATRIDAQTALRYMGDLNVVLYLGALSSIRAQWSELAREAYQDIGLWGSNGLAYMRDLPGSPALVLDLTKKITSACGRLPNKQAKAAAKAIAGAYLGVHYGLKLTLLDTHELVEKMHRASSNIRLARVSSEDHRTSSDGVQFDFRYTLIYDQFAALEDELSMFAAEADINLFDLENIWDLVPWSFVVDWFVDVASGLQALDNYHTLTSVYKTVVGIKSAKSTLDITSDVLYSSVFAPFRKRSRITASLYRRSCSSTPQIPDPLPSKATTNPLTHWVEGASLVVSR